MWHGMYVRLMPLKNCREILHRRHVKSHWTKKLMPRSFYWETSVQILDRWTWTEFFLLPDPPCNVSHQIWIWLEYEPHNFSPHCCIYYRKVWTGLKWLSDRKSFLHGQHNIRQNVLWALFEVIQIFFPSYLEIK